MIEKPQMICMIWYQANLLVFFFFHRVENDHSFHPLFFILQRRITFTVEIIHYKATFYI